MSLKEERPAVRNEFIHLAFRATTTISVQYWLRWLKRQSCTVVTIDHTMPERPGYSIKRLRATHFFL
jgi:hypothetical protein